MTLGKVKQKKLFVFYRYGLGIGMYFLHQQNYSFSQQFFLNSKIIRCVSKFIVVDQQNLFFYQQN